jgi:5'-deoxynucleotidase YfbR-like HD superfamily hydrolase
MRPDILTATGQYFNFLQPQRHTILIEDIALGLSHVCRFAGQTRTLYTVAQHSVLVCDLVASTHPQDAFAALMHDAHEAYVGDVPSPLKQLLPDYKSLEDRIQGAVLARYGLQRPLPASVKHADLVLLATEQRDFMPAHDDEWVVIAGIEPLFSTIRAWDPITARKAFMQRFYALGGVKL